MTETLTTLPIIYGVFICPNYSRVINIDISAAQSICEVPSDNIDNTNNIFLIIYFIFRWNRLTHGRQNWFHTVSYPGKIVDKAIESAG